MSIGHPLDDPGDGRSECATCGKWIWPAIHSCKRVPVSIDAKRRYYSNHGVCTSTGYITGGPGDAVDFACQVCDFTWQWPYGTYPADVALAERMHHGERG